MTSFHPVALALLGFSEIVHSWTIEFSHKLEDIVKRILQLTASTRNCIIRIDSGGLDAQLREKS